MKRIKHLSQKKNHIGIIVGIVIVALIILLISLTPGSKETTLEEIPQEQNEDASADIFAETEDVEAETIETIKAESKPVTKDKVGEEGLCEDYFFEQGDSLEIVGHTIFVDRIGKGALRLQVDDENLVMADGDSEYAGDGIRIAIGDNKILYFAGDDESNAVMMRIGCDYEDNPNEKYVVDRGEQICKAVYRDCQERFDIDLE